MMKKGLLAVFLVMMVIASAGLLSATADSYSLNVGGVYLNSSSPYALASEDGGVALSDEGNHNISWDAETGTLTLENVYISGENSDPYYNICVYTLNEPLTINLIGENTLVSSTSSYYSIFSDSSLKFTGSGSLHVDFNGQYGAVAATGGDIVFESGSCKIDSTAYGIYTAAGSLRISGEGTEVSASIKGADVYTTAVYTDGGDIVLNGGSLTADVENGYMAISSEEISVGNAKFNVSAALTDSDTVYPTVYAEDSISVIGSEVKIDGYGVYAPNGIKIENSSFSASNEREFAIATKTGIVDIDNSVVTAVSPEGKSSILSADISNSWVQCSSTFTAVSEDGKAKISNSIIFTDGVGGFKNCTDFSLTRNTQIAEGTVLVIDDGESLTIDAGCDLKNDGIIAVTAGGTLNIEGKVENNGSIFIYDGSTLTGADNISGGRIVVPAENISIYPAALSMGIEETASLEAIITPANATDEVRWSSSDSSVATVDSDGVVTSVDYGTAVITATINGHSASCTVTVRQPSSIPEPHEIRVLQPGNGTVGTSLSNSSVGAVITVMAVPDSGYKLAYITVNGERINGTSFTMPDKAVTVSAVFVPVSSGFTDLAPGAWYADAVNYVVYCGLMEGTSSTTFEPEAQMTRAMFWAILARIDGETITGEAWADDAREWAMANGVSDGTDIHGYITREQLVTMLWRYTGEAAASGALSGFRDVGDVSAWAQEAMSWAIEAGVISGVTADTLVPQGHATRAQAAAILARYISD